MRRRLAAVLVTALLGGCNRGSPSIGGLQVVEGAYEDELQHAGIGRGTLREAARGALRGAGFRTLDGRGDYQGRVEVLFIGGAEDEGSIAVEVELQLFGGKAGPVRTLAEAGVGRVPRPESAEALAGAWRQAFVAAVAEASSRVLRALAAEGKSNEELLRDLGETDRGAREQAIRVLGDRRAREAVPALVAQLQDEDLDLAERAAGALAQIGDPRAVEPIIDFTQRLEEGPYSPRYARIIGDIGGSEARGYLMTLESGHADPRVREAARTALEEMEEREREQAQAPSRKRSASRDSGRMGR